MLDLLIIIIPLTAGLAAYGLMRRREIQPVVSGLAAMLVSLVVIVGMFAVLLQTGNL